MMRFINPVPFLRDICWPSGRHGGNGSFGAVQLAKSSTSSRRMSAQVTSLPADMTWNKMVVIQSRTEKYVDSCGVNTSKVYWKE